MGKKYGKKITVKRGEIHDYLGMNFDYSEDGVVQVSMIKHLEKVFQDFPDTSRKPASTSASDHLFQVGDPEETEKLGKFLPEGQTAHFHYTVAQLLFYLKPGKEGHTDSCIISDHMCEKTR